MQGPLGRYNIYEAIAVGETASVHIALLEGAEGFRKTVAIKRLVPGKTHEQAAHAELTYEGCVGALIHHPNVVSVIDLGQLENGPFLVMEYVLGETAAGLVGPTGRLPVPTAVAIVVDVLRGLGAAHIARDAGGGELDIVHRNVRPENILVGVDGMARVIDFGSAVSALDSMTIPNRQSSLRQDEITSPEQLMGLPVDGRADAFAAAVVLWELVAGTRPFRNHGAHQAFLNRPTRRVPPASAFNMDVPPALEAVMERALSWSPNRRFESAARFADELEAAVPPSSRAEVAAYVEGAAAIRISSQRKMLDAIGAPYGRISTPPLTGRRVEPRTSSSIVRPPGSSAPPMATRSSAPAQGLRLSKQQNARLMKQFLVLQRNLRRAIGHATLVAVTQPGVALRLRSWGARARRVNPSNVMAGLSLACLLLAGTRASLGAKSSGVFSSSATRGVVVAEASCAPRETARVDSDESAAMSLVPKAVATVPNAVTASSAAPSAVLVPGAAPSAVLVPGAPSAMLVPGAPSAVLVPGAPSAMLVPGAPSAVLVPGAAPIPSAILPRSVEPATLPSPPSDTSDGRTPARRSAGPAAPRARRAASCNPPFIIDDAGIRRIKPECLR